METKYLRPILTAKEPKNKNVLWCHDGKISYYDKEWKDVSGGGDSSEITELSTQVLQDTLLNFDTKPLQISSALIIISTNSQGERIEQELNLSTYFRNPIYVSQHEFTRWSLQDIQFILKCLEQAGFFRTTNQH